MTTGIGVPIAMGARWPSGANSAFPDSGEISPVRRECPRAVLPLAAMTADLSRLPIRAWCSGPQPQGASTPLVDDGPGSHRRPGAERLFIARFPRTGDRLNSVRTHFSCSVSN